MILENDKPYYVVIGGVNGAGKSTIYQIQNSKRKELDTDRINADEILRRFGGNWNKQADINKSMREVLREIEGHFKEGKSFHHETTFGGNPYPDKKRLINAKKLGYESFLIYIGLDSPERAIERVKSRVAKGGHGVPEDLIRKRYEFSLRNLAELEKYFDNVSIYDNSDEFSYIYVKENHTVVANNTQEYAWVPKAIQDKSAETPISKQIMMDISQEEMNPKETLERIYLASDNFISDRFLKAEQVDNFYLNHKNEIKERVLAISFSTGVSEDELVGQDKKRNSCKLAYINSLGELLEKTHRQLSGMEVKRDRNIKKSDLEME
ncbi:zeta toxin family protein [Enterococcus sp. HMSC076E04]|uniref:zeta toxin family protein n=1 Tax=Enterococcus sp. HMSC076E04 TaxID=1739465 RepID=UPI0008A564B1|nr:zeta toxin family protein [Enterococcus sp. HMSC076E04]OFQ02051.1 ATPase [Enterococcus sp. HMSC076E04]